MRPYSIQNFIFHSGSFWILIKGWLFHIAVKNCIHAIVFTFLSWPIHLRWMVTFKDLLCGSVADRHDVWVNNIIWQASNHDNLEIFIITFHIIFSWLDVSNYLKCFYFKKRKIRKKYILNIYSSKYMYKVIFTHPYDEVGWILFSFKWTFIELCQSGRFSTLDLFVIFGMFHIRKKLQTITLPLS